METKDYSNLQDILHKLISKGFNHLGECLSLIENQLRVDEKEFRNNIVLLKSNLANLSRSEIIEGAISEPAKNQFTNRVLMFVDHFINSRQSEQFHEKILVVSLNDTTMTQMQKYLNTDFFVGEILTDSSQRLRDDLAEECDFVLFDTYHCHESKTSYTQGLLEQYLSSDKTNVLLLFGPWDKNYNPAEFYLHKFFAANSPFSLYARIRELREFLRIHGKPESLS